MTMNTKMLRAVVAGVAGLAAVTAVIAGGGPPGVAASLCQRSVAIDPQISVSESGRSLTFVVNTGGCAVAGEVSFAVAEGTARRPADFELANGKLVWAAGDTSPRRITATITGDQVAEPALEEFRVTLTAPSGGVHIASGVGRGRILDDDLRSGLTTVDSRVCLATRVGDKVVCAGAGSGGMSVFGAGVQTFEPGHIIQVPLVFNATSATAQTVDFDTADGNLVAGVDYVPVHQTVNVPAGTLAMMVPVQLLPHAFTHTSGHYLNVQVSNFTGGGVVSGSGQLAVVY